MGSLILYAFFNSGMLILTCSDKKSSMDNPTYDENICVTPATTTVTSNEEDERLFQNPVYSDVGHCSSKNSNLHHPYGEVKTDTPVSTSYENVHGPGAFSNKEFQNGRDVVSESCYSALDHSTDYSILKPHIPNPYQGQLQSSDDDYSQLHHK